MNAIDRARRLLSSDGATLSVVNGKRERIYYDRGVKSLTDVLDSNRALLGGASVADKLVGKAAAMLMISGGVAEVYGEVMSDGAVETFEKFETKYSFGTRIQGITNRDGTAPCPMEQTVKYIDDPAVAEEAIKRTQKILKLRAQGGKMKKLGFGMMRLPLLSSDQKDIDFEQVNKMVDEFLLHGFEYFDTAWMYHEHTSEIVARECLVKRYPRECFKLATKLPVFSLTCAEDMQKIFDEQCKKCGVEYFDYYLLHNLNKGDYPAVQEYDAFAFARKLKAEGKIRHYGFSFHDTPQLLDRILTEHPDAEFVQLQINYLDWESEGVQSKNCWEVARKHNKPVIVMEPVKGGTLAKVPADAEGLFRAVRPDMSVPSWAIRFAAGLDGVFMVLSGMSNLEQLEDNVSFMERFRPLNAEERLTVNKVSGVIKGTGAIACTACRYCTENCPKNIPIPDYFSLYNLHLIEGKNGWSSQFNYYEALTADHGKASDCVKCGACEGHCPQHLKIRDLLEKVSGVFES